MGRKQVNKVLLGTPPIHYGNSVPVSAESIRKAVNALKAYNVMDTMMHAYFSTAMLSKMEAWTVIDNTNDRPQWIQKLEKEWGIR